MTAKLSEKTIRKACYRGAFGDGDTLYMQSGSTLVLESGSTLQIDDGAVATVEASVDFGDAETLNFGDSDDVTMQWDGTNFIITAAADDSVIEIGDAGATQKSFDVIAYGDASAGADYIKWDASAGTLLFVGDAQLNFAGATPGTHPVDFTGVTLPASCNAIRGTGITPTRTSGHIAFEGTLSGTSAYMAYFQLNTAGSDIIYGLGSFAFMNSGASCDTCLSLQAITTISAGATLTSGSVLNGGYAAQFKMLWDGATVSSGMVTAVASFLYQANVTQVQGEQSSVLQLSVDSGLVQNIIHINAGSVLSTYFLNFSTETSPVLNWGADGDPKTDSPDKGLRCKVGSAEYWIPLYVNT